MSTANGERLRTQYLRDQRPASSARGMHHVTLVCSDAERTIRFYQDLLEFPLTEILDNSDVPGSSNFFFDVGNGGLLSFVDLPDREPDATETPGGLHHICISVPPPRWQRLRDKLDAVSLDYVLDGGVALHFQDPDGTKLELIADPLGRLYGISVR
jgi:catechol 2,3-dioxygenase-like lactoylglutathione lyase family enzyme